MDKKFLTAFVAPKRFEMCGLKMRPFSPRIYVNLYAIESPIVCEGKGEPKPEDVMLFLKFCSGDYKSIADVKSFTIWDKLAIWKMYGDPHSFANTLWNIKVYIEEYTVAPSVVEMGKKRSVVLKDKRTAPEIMMLVSVLIAKCGFSEDDAWDLSISRAIWYATCYAVMEGAELKFISSEEEERADDDKAALIKHTNEMAKRLKSSMDNGRIPRKNIKVHK